MSSLLIIGAGGHSRPVISTAKSLGLWNILGILDLGYKGQTETILDVPVLGSINLLSRYKTCDTSLFIAVGDGRLRYELSIDVTLSSFKTVNIIHNSALIDKSAKIGCGNFIGPFANIGPEVELGDFNIINSYANIEHETTIGNFCEVSPGAIICGRCKVLDKVFIGSNATIVEKKTLAQGTRIGAGATVVKSIIEKNQTQVGVPAKPIMIGK